MDEDTAKYDHDGLLICPYCGKSCDNDSAGDRDLETMGGYSIEYHYCEHCKEKLCVINNSVSPAYR